MTNSCGTFTVTDVPTQEADKKDLSYHNTARAAHSAGPLFWIPSVACVDIVHLTMVITYVLLNMIKFIKITNIKICSN